MTLPELQKMQVYILGKLSGDPLAVVNSFRSAEEQLGEHGIHKRKSPFDDVELEQRFQNMDAFEWNKVVRKCITQVMTCDAIILLPESDNRFCKDIISAACSAEIPVIDMDYFRKILETTPKANAVPL